MQIFVLIIGFLIQVFTLEAASLVGATTAYNQENYWKPELNSYYNVPFIDPRMLSKTRKEAKSFVFQSPDIDDCVPCVCITNINGVLEITRKHIPNSELQEIFSTNLAYTAGVITPLLGLVNAEECYNFASDSYDATGTPYRGNTYRVSGEPIQITSASLYFDAFLLGETPLVFKTKDKECEPLYAVVVEPFEIGEYPNSIFAAEGGARIRGKINYAEQEYLSGLNPGESFEIMARTISFSIKGTSEDDLGDQR
jgi:hypothetical protein